VRANATEAEQKSEARKAGSYSLIHALGLEYGWMYIVDLPMGFSINAMVKLCKIPESILESVSDKANGTTRMLARKAYPGPK
jgi:hypothetical protein